MNKRYWMSRLVLVSALMAFGQIYGFAADGDGDTTFNPNANGVVYAIAAQSDGLLLVGGDFTNIGRQSRDNIAWLSSSLQYCTPAAVGMVSWWSGDGNALDARSRNNGTLQNGATFSTG